MKIGGGCHCGCFTYEVKVDSERVGICHCTDCQTRRDCRIVTGS